MLKRVEASRIFHGRRRSYLVDDLAYRRAAIRLALKYLRGGIVDIEFVVQYLVLKHAAHYPDVGRWSDVVRILEACRILSSSDANSLKEAYLGLRSSVHRAAVSNASDGDSVETDDVMKQASAVCTRLLPNL